MTAGPVVTVTIPVFNGERYLAEAVRSVMDQTHGRVELVVVDDGSTDGTAEVARGLPVRYVRQENAGPGAAMNRGVESGRGEYVAFLSADDRWAPEKLRHQLRLLADEPEVDLAFGHVQHFVSPDLSPDRARALRFPPDPQPACSAGTLLARRATFLDVGPFDPRFRAGEFFDWYARACDMGMRTEILSEVVSFRRVHATNHSLLSRAPESEYGRVLKAIRDRRRPGAPASPRPPPGPDRTG